MATTLTNKNYAFETNELRTSSASTEKFIFSQRAHLLFVLEALYMEKIWKIVEYGPSDSPRVREPQWFWRSYIPWLWYEELPLHHLLASLVHRLRGQEGRLRFA